MTNWIFRFFIISVFQIAFITEVIAQYAGIDNDIAKLRKGLFVVKAKPGDKVIVEQLNHEFRVGLP